MSDFIIQSVNHGDVSRAAPRFAWVCEICKHGKGLESIYKDINVVKITKDCKIAIT